MHGRALKSSIAIQHDGIIQFKRIRDTSLRTNESGYKVGRNQAKLPTNKSPLILIDLCPRPSSDMIRKCANLLDRRPWEERKRDSLLLRVPRYCRHRYDLYLVVKDKSIFFY